MRNTLLATIVATTLTLGGTLAALAQGTGTGTGTGTVTTGTVTRGVGTATTGQTTVAGTRDEGFDWGWLGLLGLAGLAPLFMRRGHDARDQDRDAGRPAVRRVA